MAFKSVLAAAALAAFALPAWAADLVVTVTTPDGKPLADAVVTMPGAGKPSFPWKLEVAQKDKQFVPFVLIAPVGADVTFPNLDKFRHHVYSFSKGNKFELELYGKEEKRSFAFKTVGVAAIGCNIHDQMVGFVRVVDTQFAAKSDAAGLAEIKGAPDGKTKVTVWHPYAKSKDQLVTVDATLNGATGITVVIDVAPPSHR